MSTTPGTGHSVAPAQPPNDRQEWSRRMRFVALSTGAFATLAAVGGLAVLTGNDDGADEDATAATLARHRGMVEGTVSVIDASTMKVTDTIKVGEGPHGLRPSPDGRWLVVANVADTTLSVIDTRSNQLVTDVEVGKAPAQVAFSPDGRIVYASLNADNAVAKVDMASQQLVDTVAVGDGPIQTYVSGDNRYLLVANQGTEDSPATTVSVIDTKTFTVTATVETGQGAHGVVVDPSSTHAYVSNIYGDDVAVLDLDELKVVARIPVGDKPNGVSFSVLPAQAGRESVTLDLPEAPGVAEDDGMGDGRIARTPPLPPSNVGGRPVRNTADGIEPRGYRYPKLTSPRSAPLPGDEPGRRNRGSHEDAGRVPQGPQPCRQGQAGRVHRSVLRMRTGLHCVRRRLPRRGHGGRLGEVHPHRPGLCRHLSGRRQRALASHRLRRQSHPRLPRSVRHRLRGLRRRVRASRRHARPLPHLRRGLPPLRAGVPGTPGLARLTWPIARRGNPDLLVEHSQPQRA